MKKQKKIRTSVYIDGFNLYYGSLKNTPYKWVDLAALCQNALPPKYEITSIRCFTARVSSTPDDPGKATRQDVHLQALRKYSPNITFHFGKFQRTVKRMPLVPPDRILRKVQVNKFRTIADTNQQLFDGDDNWIDGPGPSVDVITTEEKGSDVNLAVHLVNDAWNDAFDCGVVLSNDSDLAEAMLIVKNMGKELGLITSTDRPTKKLGKLAKFHRRITKTILKNSQLPDQIPHSTLHKPKEW